MNNIGKIVHGCADLYLGSPNKNIGDAFLLAWKFPDKYTFKDDKGELMLNLQHTYVKRKSDFALMSILKQQY